MPRIFFFFLILLMVSSSPLIYGELMDANILPCDRVSFPPGDFIFFNGRTYGNVLDLSDCVVKNSPSNQIIGSLPVTLEQHVFFDTVRAPQLLFGKAHSQYIILVEITNGTKMSGTIAWDKTFRPQTTVPPSGTIQTGFEIPSKPFDVGNPYSVLVFDKVVEINYLFLAQPMAYKLPQTDEWILLPLCQGIYDNPIAPVAPGACYINDGEHTKILTFYFSTFGGVTKINDPIPTPPVPSKSIKKSSSNSGGGHNGYRSGSDLVMPDWWDNVLQWYASGLIPRGEFESAYKWVVDDMIKYKFN